MKAKKIEKRLTLKKETIVNLANTELDVVKGGTMATRDKDCPTRPLILCGTSLEC